MADEPASGSDPLKGGGMVCTGRSSFFPGRVDTGEKEIQGLLAAEKPLETLFGWLKNGTDEEEIRRQIDGMAAGIINMMAAGG